MFHITTLSGGGAERVIANLANYFASIGVDTTLLLSYKTDNEYSIDNKVKKNYLISNKSFGKIRKNIYQIKRMRQITKTEKPNVIVSFLKEPNVRNILSTLCTKTKSIISIRNVPSIEYSGFFGNIIGKYVLPFADGCVFQTSDSKKWAGNKLKNKSSIIYNPVNYSFFETKYVPIKNTIVYCGNLGTRKNISLLIKAFSNVNVINKDLKLIIYGDGPEKDNITRLINNLKMNSSIILEGETNDVPSVLKTADLFVLSSNYEGMPNALMEAMAIGVPCLSTDCPIGGPRGILPKEYLFEVGNKEELEEKILSFFKKSDEEKKNISNIMRKCAMKFEPTLINTQWKEYIECVINKGE